MIRYDIHHRQRRESSRTAPGAAPPPYAQFDPIKPARVYDNLNEHFFDWDPKNAKHYRKWARPYEDEAYKELTDYEGLELLGWQPLA